MSQGTAGHRPEPTGDEAADRVAALLQQASVPEAPASAPEAPESEAEPAQLGLWARVRQLLGR